MSNTALLLLALTLVIVITLIIYIVLITRKLNTTDDDLDTFPKILERVKQVMVDLDSEDTGTYLSDAEFERAFSRKAKFHKNLSDCAHGIDGAKAVIIKQIKQLLLAEVKEHVVRHLLELDVEHPSVYIMYEILMLKYKQKYGKSALGEFLTKYHLDEMHEIDQESTDLIEYGGIKADSGYYVTSMDILTIWNTEGIVLNLDEMYQLLAVLVFQRYKGFGVVDTIREMDIDGTSVGVSGATLQQVKAQLPPEYTVENSVWIYFRGKQIHMQFLSFGSEDELRRIVLSLIRYGNKGSLTQGIGKIVATSWDKSRITAMCPPAAECWVAFVRKFGVVRRTMYDLYARKVNGNIVTNNYELLLTTIKYLMRGMVTCGVTGQQGTGKTTAMNAFIEFIDPRETIRTLEMAFELYLRNVYPKRNILGVQETQSVKAFVLQDTLKKTDASVSLVGEVATDEVAALMLQMAKVASKFTIFSHHARTADKLVTSIRDSVANATGVTSTETVERDVIDVIKINVHLNKTPDGIRYIERITEIIPLPEGVPYPEVDGTLESMHRVTAEYYRRKTDRVAFTTRDIVRFDVRTETYYVAGSFSEDLVKHMVNSMTPSDGDSFIEWGKSQGLLDEALVS